MNGSPIKQPMRTEAIEACVVIMRCFAMIQLYDAFESDSTPTSSYQ